MLKPEQSVWFFSHLLKQQGSEVFPIDRVHACHTSSLQTPTDKEQALQVSVSHFTSSCFLQPCLLSVTLLLCHISDIFNISASLLTQGTIYSRAPSNSSLKPTRTKVSSSHWDICAHMFSSLFSPNLLHLIVLISPLGVRSVVPGSLPPAGLVGPSCSPVLLY